LCIIVALLAALLLRYIIEKPFLRLRDRILEPKRILTQVIEN
jgi:hypothetical protein